MLSKRTYIMFAASVALVIGWYFAIYVPQSSKMRALKDDQELVHGKLTSAEARLKQVGAMQSTLEECSSKWDSLRCNLVSPDSIETMLGHLMQLAKSEKLTVLDVDISFDPLLRKLADNEKRQLVDRIKVDISGRGRFFAVGDFISSLEDDIVVADVNSIELVYQQAVDPEIYFDLSMDVFIVPDEEGLL